MCRSILDSCKGTIQAQLNSCSTNDYSCLCSNYINMLSCYANCPDDIGVQTVQQQRQQNCEAASVYGSTTILGTATSSSGASSATSTSSESAAQTGFASETSTTSGSSSAASETSSSGAQNVKAAGGLLALVFAGAAAFL